MRRIVNAISGLSLLILMFGMLGSCKQAAPPEAIKISGNENKTPQQIEKGIKNARSSAVSILDHRIQSTEGKSFSAITSGVWEYEFVFDGDKMSSPGDYDGVWIDFNDDHTYSFGKLEKVEGRGKYHYGLDNALLLLLDNRDSELPVQYEVKFAGDAMVLVGNNEYGNNPKQMKLARVADGTFVQ